MPVRSLDSCVLKWPDPIEVLAALAEWAEVVAKPNRNIVRVGYIGSYAKGDWGVGSDIDVVLVLRESVKTFAQRSASFDLNTLPVPVDLLVYNLAEWEQICRPESRFGRELSAAKWVLVR
jgi:uncharacterized protein